MSKIYSQHTVESVFVGPTGHTHGRTPEHDPAEPFGLECAECEPHLVREGWVYDTALIPLTDRQEREKERVEREGSFAMQRASEAMAAAAASFVAKTPDAGAAEAPVKAAPVEAEATTKNRGGRPPGSKNRPKDAAVTAPAK